MGVGKYLNHKPSRSTRHINITNISRINRASLPSFERGCRYMTVIDRSSTEKPETLAHDMIFTTAIDILLSVDVDRVSNKFIFLFRKF